MDDIHKVGGVWKSVKNETDARKCHRHMTDRLPVLSESNSYELCSKEWTFIAGHKSYEGRQGICLCGMAIEHEYYFMNDITKNVCVMGVECCKRVNKCAVDNYIQSLKSKGICWLCRTNHKDLKTHHKSRNHKEILRKHKEYFELELRSLIRKKLERITTENEYYAKLKTHNKCVEVSCSELISKNEPSWMIRCIKCYKKYKNKK